MPRPVTTPPSPSTARRPRNRQGEGARLREEAIAAADRLLERTGDEEGLSLRAVAREAGVAAPSLYLHFASKEDLVRAVVLRHFAALKAAVDAAATAPAAAAGGPAAQLRAGCLAYCRFALDQPGAYRVLFGNRTVAFGDLPPEQIPGLDTFGTLVGGVAACIAAGLVPPGDPFRLATGVWVALHGIASLRASVPFFPWPPIEAQVEDALVGLVGLPRGDAPADAAQDRGRA